MKSIVLLFLTAIAVQGAILPFLKTPKHDGVKRVCSLTAENFTNVVTAADTAIVIFTDPTVPKSGCPTELDVFAEVTAQVLRKKNSIVCEIAVDVYNIGVNSDPVAVQVKPDDVIIFKKGRGIPYYGKRTSRALLNHLFKVNGTQINVITGKIDKIAFDAIEQDKVVGFFMQGTADYQAFEDAAARLSPSVLFYVAFDRVVAKHLKLTTVGQINLVKPFSKTSIACPQNPATVADIEAFVKNNKGSLLSKIDEHNLYDPSLMDPSKLLGLAVGAEASSLGGHFYRLITRLVETTHNNTDFQSINIVWIEPEIFPTIHLVMDELETLLGVPNKLPAFGVINVTTLQSSWLNTSLLNCSGDKVADTQNLQILQDFLLSVVSNTVAPVKIGAQAFVKPPTAQTATENSDVVLDCIIENPVGDCLWLKDGKNIGYNLDRYPHYNWNGDRLSGDCSLLIKGAQLARDSGEWVCEMTGDETSPTLTSPPVKVLITAADQPSEVKAEL
ncbi:LOW QUALITY PROTEIN: calsequestrin-1-like [Uloborus diversus]|uniref:LOW QUALITY PROTEIN: calsequestrin-1-like n=1 Tax=Uloborus diversus TaxID=327109 RepID=UPI00240A93E7|nr:LOW QUALITY PROTEIN: calsequestrin-1-like [Uloborus diversus]